jgi:hypothetical protein
MPGRLTILFHEFSFQELFCGLGRFFIFPLGTTPIGNLFAGSIIQKLLFADL